MKVAWRAMVDCGWGGFINQSNGRSIALIVLRLEPVRVARQWWLDASSVDYCFY